jgi:PEP-CTERM/exosortase A-associated glycosyltransferase
MKVLHVLETSIPHTVGYTVRANAIIENQVKLGLEVVVVTSPLFPTNGMASAYEEFGGVRYYRTNHIPTPASARTKLGSYWRRAQMMRLYRRAVLDIAVAERVDIIHAHSSYANAYAAMPAARRLNLPLVYEVRTLWGESAVVEDGWRSNSWKHRMIWRLELGAMRGADCVVPIAQGIYDELASRGVPKDKMRIVANGVDTSKFIPRPKDSALAASIGLADRFIVGFIGSMRKLEGLSTLLDAYNICVRSGAAIGLVLVGDGPDRIHLEAMSRELNLKGVHFTGNVPHHEVAAWYSILNVVAYPRIRAVINERVTPLKPLEVMALGKICVGSDVGGLLELIKNERTGMIFRSGDAAHLAQVLMALKADPSLMNELGQSAMSFVKNEREWSVIVGQYCEIYSRLVSSKQAAASQRPMA